MKRIFFLVCTVLLLTSSCAPGSAPAQTSLRTWIDAPLSGSTIPLAPYQIVAHSSDPVEIQVVEISVDGMLLDVFENPEPANLLFTASFSWTPPAPGVYLIQARGKNSQGEWSPPAQVRVIVEEALEALPSLEIIPSATPGPLVINCEAQVTAAMNTTCRSGPSTYHEPLAYLLEEENALFLGGNLDLSWWAVLPESQEDHCWVSGQTVETSCLPEEIEILESPPYLTRIFPSHAEFYWGDHSRRSVTIQAQCGGESPVTAVQLIYHVAGKSEWYTTSMTTSTAGIWQAQIQAHDISGYNTISSAPIEYYLEAANQAGLNTKSPLFNNLVLKEAP